MKYTSITYWAFRYPIHIAFLNLSIPWTSRLNCRTPSALSSVRFPNLKCKTLLFYVSFPDIFHTAIVKCNLLKIFSLYVCLISFMRFVFIPVFSNVLIFFFRIASSLSFDSFSWSICDNNFSLSFFSSATSEVRSFIFVELDVFVFSNSFFKRFNSLSSLVFVCSTCITSTFESMVSQSCLECKRIATDVIDCFIFDSRSVYPDKSSCSFLDLSRSWSNSFFKSLIVFSNFTPSFSNVFAVST